MSKSNIVIGTKPWADRINVALDHGTQGFLQAGRILLSAKESVPHGSFQKMLNDELRCSPRTAQRLMKVAADDRLNATHESYLPPSLTTRYLLALLSDEEFDQGLAEGRINKDTSRDEATRLRTPKEPPAPVIDAEYHEIAPAAEPVDELESKPPRNQRDVNFWATLVRVLSEWTKLGSIEELVPTEDTMRVLEQYELGKFIDELDRLRLNLRDIAEGVGDAA